MLTRLPYSTKPALQTIRHTCAVLCVVLTGLAHGQTPDAKPTIRTTVVSDGLVHPWSVAFLPEGRFLVTERPGRLRVIEPDGRIGLPVSGLPRVDADGQGGLLDVMLDTDFARNQRLFFCYAEPGANGSGTALATAHLSANRQSLEQVKVIFSQKPKVKGSAHFGCRLAQNQTMLWMTLGDRYSLKDNAQKLNNHQGKTIRILKDGRVPADNQFTQQAGALPEVWTYGHRNPQGLAFAPDGTLWSHEHGPQGGDEVNILAPGANHGWPVVTYGENYGGGKIGDGLTTLPGLSAPLHHWVPSIAPSGMAFLTSDRYGKPWVGNLFVGSLKFGYLNRIELSEPFKGKVVREHKLLADLGERIRDVRQGPDGYLYVLTDSPRGKLIRLLTN